MRNSANVAAGLRALFVVGGSIWVIGGFTSCGTAPTPFAIQGPGQFGNEPPTLEFQQPTDNLAVGQGAPFLIGWQDDDRDDNASISFLLVNTATNVVVHLVSGLEENDATGPSTFTVITTLIAPGSYNLLGIIDDGTNAPVNVFAPVTSASTAQRLVITIAPPGVIPPTVPPTVVVTEPAFNLSVAQEDVLRIVIQPTALLPDATSPFDPDSDVRLFVLLDLDLDPNNDDPANPDPAKIIVLQDTTIAQNAFEFPPVEIAVDLTQIPARPTGEPYFIRATVDDLLNPRVHSYAAGTISVVQLAAGTVDLFDMGRTKSGARFQGFNPIANLGSSISGVSDFDADGLADFVMVAQFGNPQNIGPVGEAYLVYGQDKLRFGGIIPVNSISNTVSGAVFQAPPVRTFPFDPQGAPPRTDGITDVDFVRDLSGDGRPEILFGLPHVHGAFDSTDYDPSDDSITGDENPLGCFPDFLVNNLTTNIGEDVQFYSGGMAVLVNSQNRDSDPRFTPVPNRLDTTAVDLELCGQRGRFFLDTGGLSGSGNIIARADNAGLSGAQLGSDNDEAGRIAGARFIAGGYDFVDAFFLQQTPREGLFGQSVGSLGDLNSDGLDEIIISAPRNERYVRDLAGSFSTHLESTRFRGSITVLPGRNYNQTGQRDIDSDEGTSQTPFLDQHNHAPFGRCSNPRQPRHYDIPLDSFSVLAEDIDDMLGDGQSGGDFNRDGLDDILCGAPLNDRTTSLPDSGATYVIYGRSVFGEVRLADADDSILRPPMLRIRGLKPGDQIGWAQTAGLDVNGDRIDDVFIASPRTDFGPVSRTTCAGDFNQDGLVNQNDLAALSFDTCLADFGDEVFTDDACKVFDYDNDRDIDEDDRCIFCCLSDDCVPDAACTLGQGALCCDNLVDNGFVGIIFGGVFIDGDRNLAQLATTQLPGTVFYGGQAGDQAGFDISSAGDFNLDGFGDILIVAPGRITLDSAGRQRLGVVYLVFGGTHLINTSWSLDEVGTEQLPGMIFLSPYVLGRPNEAAPTTVGFIGDINNDGFGDIAIGNPRADFIDPTFPQGPDAPGSDPSTGRRSDVGDVYIVYGNNFGTNRATATP